MTPEEWSYNVDKLFFIEIFLNRLKKQGKLTKKQEKEIRLYLKPLTYTTYLNSQEIKNNKKLKKEVKLSCLNDYFSNMGFSKSIRFINIED